ncbi:hypothetical protein ATKI12_4206 [Kitasatospora sp. Ki12]
MDAGDQLPGVDAALGPLSRALILAKFGKVCRCRERAV